MAPLGGISAGLGSSMPLELLDGATKTGAAAKPTEGTEGTSGAASFANVLKDKLSSLNAQQVDAGKASEDMATGRVDDVAQTMLRIEQANVTGRFPLPDLSAHYRHVRGWGHVQVAGILRQIKWDDLNDDQFDLSGDATGWGVNVSTNVKVGRHVIRASVVYGEGVQNYMNDAPADVGIESNAGDPVAPVKGVALPVLGLVAFLDHSWNERFTSSVGYSMVDIDNSELQAPDAYKRGHYAVGNVLYTPVPGFMTGVELQWGRRENFSDGFSSDGVRVQFSAKYNFSKSW